MSKKQSLSDRVPHNIAEELIDDKPTHQEQQIEQNTKKIFSSDKKSKDSYIQKLKTLYTTFDQLSEQIQNSGVKLEFGSSQDDNKALQSLDIIKTNLFNELSKFEKITEQGLKEQNIDKNNPIENLDQDNIKNLQLFLDEAKFITSNLTEALDYDEKIKHLKQIQGVLKEMTGPGNGLKFKEIFTNNLKNIVPSLTEGKKNSTKENHDINHELDRMLKEILKEQEKLLSLLVSNGVLKYGEEKELFDNLNKIDNKIHGNQDNSKQLRDAKQRYIELHQQEHKLLAIKQSPDKYIANNAVTEKLNKDIKTLRKEIIVLRQNASAIEKESNELERKKFATGILERVFNRIFYGSDKTINKKVEALEAKKGQIDDRAFALTTTYKKQNEKRTENSQIYNAIRTNSPDKLKSVIPDIDPMELYNKVIEQRKTAKTQIPKKESWVKRILFGQKSNNKGAAISNTK